MENEIPPKLKWACRRGMLELDVLLGNFLRNCYLQLDTVDQELFIKLLACEDQDLFYWLTDRAQPLDESLRPLIQQIRHHAQYRF